MSLTTAGDTSEELVGNLGGKAQIDMRAGARVGLDLKTLAQATKRGDVRGWQAAGTSTTGLDGLGLRLDVQQGVVQASILHAKSGMNTFSGSGSIDLTAQSMDFALAFGTTDPVLRPLVSDALVLSGPWAAPSIKLEHRGEAVHRPSPVTAPVTPAGRP
jgi:AsmA protein